MNVNDTEIAWAILQKNGYARTKELDEVGRLGSSPAAQVSVPGFAWSAVLREVVVFAVFSGVKETTS